MNSAGYVYPIQSFRAFVSRSHGTAFQYPVSITKAYLDYKVTHERTSSMLCGFVIDDERFVWLNAQGSAYIGPTIMYGKMRNICLVTCFLLRQIKLQMKTKQNKTNKHTKTKQNLESDGFSVWHYLVFNVIN